MFHELVTYTTTTKKISDREVKEDASTTRLCNLYKPITTQYSRVILENLVVAQLLKKYPAFFEAKKLINILISQLANPIMSHLNTLNNPICLTSILILLSHLSPKLFHFLTFPTKNAYKIYCSLGLQSFALKLFASSSARNDASNTNCFKEETSHASRFST